MPLNSSPQTYSPVLSVMTKVVEDQGNYQSKPERKHPKTTLFKRIPLHKLMDLKVDYAFKQLFGREKNKQITVVFLNAILQKTGREPIKDITFANVEEVGEYIGDKASRLDLLVTTASGENINVEIQFTNQYDMIKRSIYYWTGLYRAQMEKKMSYKELKPVISINIMNFDYFKQTDRFHTMFHLYEDEEKFKLTDVMEYHFIEMPKLIQAWKEEKLDPWNDVLARWLLLLGMVDSKNDKIYDDIYRELEEIAMKDKPLKSAFHTWEELSMSKKEFHAYEARLKYILDEEAAKREAELREQEARQEARKEEKEEIAQRLLKRGLSVDEVTDITLLSQERVAEIKWELLN